MRIARKHISWYTKGLVGSAHFAMNQLQTTDQQLSAVNKFFSGLPVTGGLLTLSQRSWSHEQINENEIARCVRKAWKIISTIWTAKNPMPFMIW